jgi:uncharacterized protein with gpF-like domain
MRDFHFRPQENIITSIYMDIGKRRVSMNDTLRSALVTLIKSRRQKMSRAQRRREIKPQRWLYPWAAEARYAVAIRAWFRPMKDYVHSYLNENQKAILRGDSAAFRADDLSATRLDAVPGKSFKRMIDSLDGWMGQYVPADDESKSGSPIYMGLGNIADSVFDFNEGQYEKGAKSVLGVEFPVGEDWWPLARNMWRQRNYDAVQGDMRNYIGRINMLTEKAVTSGLSVKELAKQIASLDDKLKGRAAFIARDQIGKLNGDITQRRMEDVGLTMYIWETSGDERVRGNPGGKYPDAKPSHWLMDGALCLWSDSTVFSQDGGKTWIPRPSGAVLLHPGSDYLCRCTAIAEWNELVGEADALIAQYEELDAISAQNIAAMPKAPQPAPTAPQPKKFITQKILKDQVADLEKQMQAIDMKTASITDKKLYEDLKAEKEAVEAEIEKKKIAAERNLLTKKVKNLEKELQGIQVKTYSGIFTKNEFFTTAEWESKSALIQARKDFYLSQINSGLPPDLVAQYQKKLALLEEFNAEGKRYADILTDIQKAKGRLTSLKKSSIFGNSPFTEDRKNAALWAKTPKAADDALRDVSGEVWQGASKAERQAIYEYTGGSGGFNRPLRGYDKSWQDFKGVGKVPLDNEGRESAIRNMTKLIDRSKYDFDVWIQRGVETSQGAARFLGISEDNLRHWSQVDFQRNLVDTKIDITDEGFVSCGSSKGKGFSGYIFNIYCPKGTKMMYAEPFSDYGHGDKIRWDSPRLDGISRQSSFGHEDETIIQRGTTFRMTKIEKKGSNIYFDIEVDFTPFGRHH